MSTKLAKWGHSLAIRIPKGITESVKWREGDHLDLSITEDGTILLRPVRRKYTLDQLVADITPENCHAETEWGEPVGKEL